MPLSAIELTLYADQLEAVCEEMGQVLQLSAFSPNIRERRDFSCAIFAPGGELVAQGRNIPVHLGSMSSTVKSAILAMTLEGEFINDGDVIIVNDPYEGGTHLPDITAIMPYWLAGQELPMGLLAVRAHHADIGGISSGSMPLSTEIFQEGLIIPPVRLVRGGEVQRDLMRLICRNSRTARERRGDLEAQLAALARGKQRLQELASAPQGRHAVSLRVFEELMERSRRAVDDLRRHIRRTAKETTVEAEDYMELADGGRAKIRGVLHVWRDDMCFQFIADPQLAGPLNAVHSIVESAVFYVMRCLLPPEVPSNQGLMDDVVVITREGDFLDPLPPAAVAGGNVETSQRVVDVVLRLLGQLLPLETPALSQGTMNNLTMGGIDTRWGGREAFAYYETMGGGHGGHPQGAGASGRHSHMTNSLNTPIEALEHAYPLRVWRYGLREGSGGAGHNPGGEGLVREVELLSPAEATMLSQRRVDGPSGASGGGDGATGRNSIVVDGATRVVGGVFSERLAADSRLLIETPGGGGWGTREP